MMGEMDVLVVVADEVEQLEEIFIGNLLEEIATLISWKESAKLRIEEVVVVEEVEIVDVVEIGVS